MQYSCELLILLLSDGNAIGYYPKLVISRRTMHQVEHQAPKRTRRSGELVAAPGDLEHRAIKFVMLEFPLVLWVFNLPMHTVTKYKHDSVNGISINAMVFHFHFSNYCEIHN